MLYGVSCHCKLSVWSHTASCVVAMLPFSYVLPKLLKLCLTTLVTTDIADEEAKLFTTIIFIVRKHS